MRDARVQADRIPDAEVLLATGHDQPTRPRSELDSLEQAFDRQRRFIANAPTAANPCQMAFGALVVRPAADWEASYRGSR